MTGNVFNSAAECAGAADTARLHDERLRAQLAYVQAHSVFYQEKFAAAGVDAARVRATADLPLLPFTEQSELRESQLAAPPYG
ncbi:MAG: phenylacetate--CoA ligase family protein, partial [Gammaproteobacteria bacterium]